MTVLREHVPFANFTCVDLDGIQEFSYLDVMEEYYPYWSEQMMKVGKSPFITPKLCLEDWFVVNWAQYN